jgi:hypothetical protein
MNPVHNSQFHFYKICFNIVLSCTSIFLVASFLLAYLQNPILILFLTNICYMPCQSQHSWADNYIWRREQVMNLLLFHSSSVQIFSSAPCSSLHVRDQVSHPLVWKIGAFRRGFHSLARFRVADCPETKNGGESCVIMSEGDVTGLNYCPFREKTTNAGCVQFNDLL